MVAKKKASKTPKTPAKKVVRKRSASKASKTSAEMKSFRLYKEEQRFTETRITRQTIYWVILLLFIIVTQLWILKVQLDLANVIATLTPQ